MKLKCLVVDDEPLASSLIKDYIKKLHPTLTVAGVCNSAIEAQNYLSKNEIDVLFMDIEMPNINGIDFLRAFNNPPYTVITTAYSEFAATSYELNNVVDYLIKPIAFERFVKTANRLITTINKDNNASKGTNSYNNISLPETKEKKNNYIFLKQDGKIIKVDHSNIRYIESFGEYAKFFTEESRVVSRLALSKILATLPSTQFIRIHRSYIINISFVTHLEGNQVVMGDTAIPVSRGKKDELLNFIKTHGYLE
ncbi:LytTR family DNA-binding domain-containing protein [Aquimarina sp. 2201CG5-10]|uniref:LytR/AlgR family response regulator transcription factor n=1 Tax=Aquimarina callyspongiae TaxID=3098150 RepID=UPI002AB3CBBF|nr:LytTR family DNA-binding domain-containing protein [Aquimarina sp. 2201CG5-10]MDY8136133.1 LytTR family DNA-binding domain-containing protein [Aquimarina sp. 2201CG5-10]